VLALAVVRARRLMMRSATEAHAAAALSRFFAAGVAGEITGAARVLRPGEATRRDLTVVFFDLRGFTQLSQRLGPEGTIALLAGFHACVVPAVSAAGGSVDKYLGDGILVTFGGTRDSPTHAADALRAAADALGRIAAWREGLGDARPGVGIGIDTGPALVGVTGAEERLEFTVLGDVVNRAAKIEKHCKQARRPILATAATMARAEAQGYAGAPPERLAGAAVAGVAGPVDLVAWGAPALAA
ncbi:MAG: adenylate/guanylate cyclase domain-containing protein, partial [Gemmobacter sp.]